MKIKTWLFLITLLLFLVSSKNTNSQDLVPTETKALMEILVTDFSKNPLANETLIFIGDKTKKEISVTTGKDGKTKALLPEGETYDIKYREFTEQVNYSKVEIPTKLGAYTFQLNIKFEPEKVFTLKDVHFDTGKATITSGSFPSLNDLVGALKAKPTMTIEIAGHTDNVGTPEANQKLSQERANSVKQYLVTKGISIGRLTAKGYGDTQPIADNNVEEGRKQNRRTEVRIIKN